MNTLNLIKAVEGKQLNEFLSFLKKKPSAPPKPAAPSQEEHPDASDDVSVLHQFVEAVKGAPSGSDRYVLRMTTQDLKQHYLKSGGGKSFVENLSDEVLSKKDALEVRIKLLHNYDIKKLIGSGKYDSIVLLDIPKELTSKLATALSGALDINGIRDALTRMMNHRYYVMTLSASRLKKVASKATPVWNDIDELTRVLDPSIAIAYPKMSDLATIKQAYVDQFENDTARASNDQPDEDADDEPAPAPVEVKPAKPQKLSNMSSQEKADTARRSLLQLKDELASQGVDAATIDKVTKALSTIKSD